MSKRPATKQRTPVIDGMESIDLLPGFKVLEHTLKYTRLLLPNGFDVTVYRAGPYMYEILDNSPDMQPMGPYVIKIQLMKGLTSDDGIIVDHIYEPPIDENGQIYCPDAEEHPQAYAYYHGWLLHEQKRKEHTIEIGKKRRDLALVNCVKIHSGPICVDDDEWYRPMADAFGKDIQSINRYLLFLKTQLVSSESIRDVLIFLWRVEEVTIEGLKQAFDSFRSSLSWQSPIRTIR